MFNQKAFRADGVSRRLYDAQTPGLVILPGFLDEDFREALLQEINCYAHLFKPVPRKHLNAHQEFSYFYIGEADEEPAPVQSNFKAVLALRDRYSDLYGSMWSLANFSTAGRLNSVAVQKYPQGSIGITLHRDESRYVNLISIFVLKGEAPFLVSLDRDLSCPIATHTRAGDLVLLRAPRGMENVTEKRLRPFHAVGQVLEERITLLLRERVGP